MRSNPSRLLRLAFAAACGALLSYHALAATCGTSSDKTPVNLPSGIAPPGTPEDLAVNGNCLVTPGTYYYAKVTIASGARLTFADASIDFNAYSIVIDGIMAAGDDKPIGSANPANRVVIRLSGDKPGGTMSAMSASAHAKAAMDDCGPYDKGIFVRAGGALRLFGKRGVQADSMRSKTIGGPNPGSVSWTYLGKPAGPAAYQTSLARIGAPVAAGGEKVLYVAADVTRDWMDGDWIVVGTTSFSPFESEFVKIKGAPVLVDDTDPNGAAVKFAKVTLDDATPLRHYHFGGWDPGRPSSFNAKASAKFNYGVDERAAVGLVSRSIVLTAKMPDFRTAPADSLAWGGETKFCRGYLEAKLQGVEIEKFGKDRLGSYPIHFHMVGDAPAATLVNSNSIHHSYNHCVTLHLTNNVTVSNNVCARALGHLFYEEKPSTAVIKDPVVNPVIANTGLKFHDNLGLGAMANLFDLAADVPKVTIDGRQEPQDFWEGDYLGRTGDGYHGRMVPNTDDGTLAVHGSCFVLKPDGRLDAPVDPRSDGTCNPESLNIYFAEPPTGFWISNPGTELLGNSIGGCQSIGKAFWYVPPKDETTYKDGKPVTTGPVQLKFQPLGAFVNNRANACFDGVFGETDTGISTSEQLFPKVGGDSRNKNLIARFDAFTAFRIRNRGVWMRPTWFVFEHARVAMSREGVSLVTSGGLDGNAPGVWGLLKNATVVGVSTNNVDRFGPCPSRKDYQNNEAQEGQGCVDWNTKSATIYEKGYPSPAWNFAGFYIYDGPARIHDVRFVNFRVDPKPLLTSDDVTFMSAFTKYFNGADRYEGDAALGWFQNNQSAYPTATDVRGLAWDGVDLRHQVFTQAVNFGQFDDGDKNTAVIDRDGSLTGFKLATASGAAAHDDYPISLNNLPFNAAGNAVDECHAVGAQDTLAEKRPTSLISPGNYGTLEFEAFALPYGVAEGVPPGKPDERKLTQFITFAKDLVDYNAHQTMQLHSRNNQGIWEPKVANKHGYTLTAQPSPSYANARPVAGIPYRVAVSLNDIVMPGVSKANPFFVRVGVCYTNKDGTHPDGNFEIRRGYRSWGGNGVDPNDADLRKLFIPLSQAYPFLGLPTPPDPKWEQCFNLVSQNPQILNDPVNGCPATGIFAPGTSSCPDGSTPTVDRNKLPVCAFPKTTLTKAAAIDELTNKDGTPVRNAKGEIVDKWFYDKTTGMLFFYVLQDRPNAVASSPLGSCVDRTGTWDPACPDPSDPTWPESYYACPPEGCPTYVVQLDKNTAYDPGESACTVKNDPQSLYTAQPKYVQPAVTGQSQLAYAFPKGTAPPVGPNDGSVVQPIEVPPKVTPTETFYHRTAGFGGKTVPPNCPGTPAPNAVGFN